MPAAPTTSQTSADVVVIGAGPAGSATAWAIARTGRDVVLIERESFPRDKVCGDGLTPRAVAALRSIGLRDEADGRVDGWATQRGLRMHGGGVVLDMPWPELADFPNHSVTATRSLFDHTLARNAEAAGARLWQRTEVVDPVLVGEGPRVGGVTWRRLDDDGEPVAAGTVRAPVVVAADGVSSRFAVRLGLGRLPQRPLSVAIRAYYDSPRSSMDMMEGFLELHRGTELLPGYGWIFPLADGRVNVGWGQLNSSEHFRKVSYRGVLDEWTLGMPEEWGISPSSMVGRPRSAPLPMGHNRKPLHHHGVLLVGDSGGMVNPFNGEGISYAIEAGVMAAEAVDAAFAAASDRPLDAYPAMIADAWGGYYTLGNVFVRLIGQPTVMRLCTELGMPRRTLMEFVFRTMAHLINARPADATDRLLSVLSRAVPAA